MAFIARWRGRRQLMALPIPVLRRPDYRRSARFDQHESAATVGVGATSSSPHRRQLGLGGGESGGRQIGLGRGTSCRGADHFQFRI